MEVYAEFYEEVGLQYRTKTILRFGSSWDLIGSVIMKNPGSAKPIKKINQEQLQLITKFYNKEINPDNWFVFKDDNTMKRIASIFNGNYIGKDIKLEGVIQIFNLFNIREAKFFKAIELANQSDSKFLLPDVDETISLLKNKPALLAFRWEYTNKTNRHQNKIENFTRIIFNHVKESEFMYLHPDILENNFYHPFGMYINCVKNIPVLEKFISFYE